MSPLRRCVLLSLIVCEIFVNIEASPSKLSEGSTSAIVNIMKRLQKKGHLRLRRSYLDNRIDTFPAHPAYFSQHKHASLPDQEQRHNFHPRYSLDSAHDAAFDTLVDPLSFQDTRPRAMPPPSPAQSQPFPKQPLAFPPLQFGEGDQSEDEDLDFSALLPATFDVKAPVSERAAKEADSIMDDFLNFLELRASGALDECLRKLK